MRPIEERIALEREEEIEIEEKKTKLDSIELVTNHCSAVRFVLVFAFVVSWFESTCW
jgi:hypothetical protein